MIDPRPIAKLAKLAYTLPPSIDVGSFRAIVGDVGEIDQSLGRYLVIRGTCDMASAATDIEAIPTPVVGLGLVHLGFWKALEGAWDEIEWHLDDAAPVVIAGHSLGGALAFLAAARLCLQGRPPKAVIAFAPARPSIGGELADLLARHGVEVQIYRLGDDQVPMLPLGFDLPGPVTQLGAIDSLIDELDDHAIDHIIAALDVAFTALGEPVSS